MVEQLAKLMYPEGIAVAYDPGDSAGSAARTSAFLQRERVTLFEATLLQDGKLVRVDILTKCGNRFELIEVKSVSFDSDETGDYPAGPFRGKRAPHVIATKFQNYLEDVTFQVSVLRALYPDADIVPFLMLVDQARRTTIEGLPARFRIERGVDGRDLLVKKDGSPTASSHRQRIQIEHTRRSEPWVGERLGPALSALRYPLHFIDFETSLLALPYHRGMRGYEKVAFQWSCHTVGALGAEPMHREWLNTVEAWPNAEFVASLRTVVGDAGDVLTWSPYEATVLKEIRGQLERYGGEHTETISWLDTQ